MSAEGAALLCCPSIDVPVPRLWRSTSNSFDLSRPYGRAYSLPAFQAWTVSIGKFGFRARNCITAHRYCTCCSMEGAQR